MFDRIELRPYYRYISINNESTDLEYVKICSMHFAVFIPTEKLSCSHLSGQPILTGSTCK